MEATVPAPFRAALSDAAESVVAHQSGGCVASPELIKALLEDKRTVLEAHLRKTAPKARDLRDFRSPKQDATDLLLEYVGDAYGALLGWKRPSGTVVPRRGVDYEQYAKRRKRR